MTGEAHFEGLVRFCIACSHCRVRCSPGPRRAQAADEVIDRVLAVASGELITLSDVRAAIELGRVQVRQCGRSRRASCCRS